jgi:hypothetical protein
LAEKRGSLEGVRERGFKQRQALLRSFGFSARRQNKKEIEEKIRKKAK